MQTVLETAVKAPFELAFETAYGVNDLGHAAYHLAEAGYEYLMGTDALDAQVAA
jgi:hypothetical protein